MEEKVYFSVFISWWNLLFKTRWSSVALDPISPLPPDLLFGMNLDTDVWLRVVLDVECSVCRRVVNYHTEGILSQSTGAWQPPRARCFSKVGWLRCSHYTWWICCRTVPVPRVDTSLRSSGSCPWGSWWFWTRFWAFPTHLVVFRLWGTWSSPQKNPGASASWAVYHHWESPLGKSASRGYKKPLAPNTNPSITFNVPVNLKDILVSHSFHGYCYCALTSLRIIF